MPAGNPTKLEVPQCLSRKLTEREVLAEPRPLLFRLGMAWELGTERVLQLTDYHYCYLVNRGDSDASLCTLNEMESRNTTEEFSRSAAASFRCLTAVPREGITKAGILPGCLSLDREVERQRSGSNHRPCSHEFGEQVELEMAQWLKREFTDRKVLGSNPTQASRLILSTLGQPGSISALVLPSGGMAAQVLPPRCNSWTSQFVYITEFSFTPSVFNTDVSLPYNHDLFESLIVKKRITAILITRTPLTSVGGHISNQAQWGSRGPHPSRRVAPTAPKRFVISVMPFCQVKGWPSLCFRHSELGMGSSTLFGK
ncbi:hypothetical protein CSKR_102277 [Clonorchis sinensis]|uniref:Uncharacterized protein n=1 Tax=Clonorchis sinensis TaxID=79923 RepID=A0A3R7JKF3_CLOSI|nr:hypothetical protein CSKR_102277 [Clonorchis sinensis]